MRRPGDPYDVVVIGGGMAGLTAAHHAALRGMAVVCIDEGGHMGGLVINVSALDGYPAMGPVGGAELASGQLEACLLYTSPSPRDRTRSRMPSSA